MGPRLGREVTPRRNIKGGVGQGERGVDWITGGGLNVEECQEAPMVPNPYALKNTPYLMLLCL